MTAMTIFSRIKQWLFPEPDYERYCQRFAYPTVDRLRANGVSESDIENLWAVALSHADPSIVGMAPGSLFRNMADEIEDGGTVEDVLRRFAKWNG